MSIDIKALFDAEPRSPLYVAINRVMVENNPNLMRMMRQASSEMCLATALTPGFQGFDLMRQTGSCPMGMRWGARRGSGASTRTSGSLAMARVSMIALR
jgi:sulfur oxygenase/reductase